MTVRDEQLNLGMPKKNQKPKYLGKIVGLEEIMERDGWDHQKIY